MAKGKTAKSQKTRLPKISKFGNTIFWEIKL